MNHSEEFREIAHCGGKMIVDVREDHLKNRTFSIGVSHSSAGPAAWFGIYALPLGIPVGTINFRGISNSSNAHPETGTIPVFISSDSEGKFGHECSYCEGYWRSNSVSAEAPTVCPYCGTKALTHQFLTKAQRRYVTACCELVHNAVGALETGSTTVDFDKVSDLVLNKSNKPPFYYSEISQQTKFTCSHCTGWNDILGKYGYCSRCGSLNACSQLELRIKQIRDQTNSASSFAPFVCDIVEEFDSCATLYTALLLKRIPVTRRRRALLDQKPFHDFKKRSDDLLEVFDINLLKGLDEGEKKFAHLMFHRRHVYVHKGGEADERYLSESGDNTVKLKQLLHETKETIHRLAGIVVRCARNFHDGFHELVPKENTYDGK